MEIYPLTFLPILKQRIWGGDKLKNLFAKESQSEQIGESWEISTIENEVSIIANGTYKNTLFTELISQFPKEILGEKIIEKYGNNFPLLFKFLDASQDLSIQVHPNDILAKKRHNCLGKTEMWYIIQADQNSRNIIGFKEKSSAKEYTEKLKNNDLLSILNQENVQKGDVFFLETGTIHAVGKGIVLAEIQQTSDITYRIFDWNRTDKDGKSRELHLELAFQAINYNPTQSRKNYSKTKNKANNIVQSKYFTTNYILLEGKMFFNQNTDFFRVYMCIDGNFSIVYKDKKYNFEKGKTILLPAILKEFHLEGEAELLEVFVE